MIGSDLLRVINETNTVLSDLEREMPEMINDLRNEDLSNLVPASPGLQPLRL